MTQNNKIIILEKQARQSILTSLLKDQTSITDTQFISLNVFLNSFIKDEQHSDWFKAVALLEKEAEHHKILKEILRFPITADHLLDFIQQMADEGWTIDDLPQDNQKDQALKEVLKFLLPHFDRRVKQWEAINQTHAFDHVSLYDHFYTYPVYQRLLKLKDKGLTLIDLPQKEPKVSLFYAKNPRSEAQACVQSILSDSLPFDEQVIVCLDRQLQNQVESFLIQYEVPYFRTNEYKTNASFRLIQDLLRLKFDSSQKSVLKLLQNDKLNVPNRLELITYIETFGLGRTECLQPFEHVKNVLEHSVLDDVIRIKDYLNLEKKAEFGIQSIRARLNEFIQLESNDFIAFVQHLFDFYVSLFEQFTDEDVESINKVKSTLEEGAPILKLMEQPYEALMYQLSKLTLSTKQSSGVILTDLKHAHIPHKKRLFILSCTQDHYPQLPTSGGLFDDDYIRKISPQDQQARYDHHMNHLQKLQKSADEVIYSYPMGSYEGKAKKLPYELESYLKLKNIVGKAWPLIETDNETSQDTKNLQQDIAKQIYFTDNELKGSISSFEKYFHCPYQYYLSAGLKLKEPPRFGIDNAIMGTLLHLVLEKAIHQDHKAYAKAIYNKESDYLRPYFEDLKRLFKHKADELEIMFERTVVMLHLSLEFLISREEDSPFNNFLVEKEYEAIVDLGVGKTLHISGTIDRIDVNDSGFLIIDYKSSSKSLSENFVQRGIQLQLLTYMWVAHEFLRLGTPYGAYYFSLGQYNTSVKALKYTKKNGVEPFDDPQVDWFKGRRLKGWPTQNPIAIDSSGQHLVGKAQYDMAKIEPFMKEKYRELINGLEKGQISKQNLAGSCKFCNFKHFCQFKGEEKKLPGIKKDDSRLLMTKEEN